MCVETGLAGCHDHMYNDQVRFQNVPPGADTGFQKGGGVVRVTVKYYNAAYSHACKQLFFPYL